MWHTGLTVETYSFQIVKQRITINNPVQMTGSEVKTLQNFTKKLYTKQFPTLRIMEH